MAPIHQADRQSVHLRMPAHLYERVRELAAEQGVSVNGFLSPLVAGSIGWKPADDPKFNRRGSTHGSD
jgi:predicted DNA binding CopG/RHH family protein